MGEVSLNGSAKYERVPFGKEMLKHFLFDPTYRILNHGSFGAYPRVIRDLQRAYQDDREAFPDASILYKYPALLDESRAAVAKLIDVPTETVVLVSNATTGINTVLRNLEWHEDGRDEILYFNTIYGACGNTVKYICEYTRNLVGARQITLKYPLSDAALLAQFKAAISASRAARKVPRVAIFDTITSLPGLRMPFEALTKICAEEGILSVIDGAHGVGHIPLSLSALNPDFFVSNLHKWLYVPRGAAVLYVPLRNQHLLRTSVPTSHGFIPKGETGAAVSLLPHSTKSEFVNNFEFVGTIDNTNYLVVPEAIKWRQEVCGGQESITTYCTQLARDGGKAAADILGTKVLDNEEHSLTNCCLTNVLLPLTLSSTSTLSSGVGEVPAHFHAVKEVHVGAIASWIHKTLIDDHKTFFAIFFLEGQWWARLSAQIYLDIGDFEWAGQKLKDVCERVGKEEFLGVAPNKEVDGLGKAVEDVNLGETPAPADAGA